MADAPRLAQSEPKITHSLKSQLEADAMGYDRSLPEGLTLWAANLSLSQSSPSDLEMLRRVAEIGEQQKQRSPSIRKEETPIPAESERVGNFAAPLSPLRDRDLAVLEDLFQRDNIYAIEVDISQMLLRLLPEPCWEEDPFEFLQEFLGNKNRP